jgi:uncharacterized integral membrane protein
MRIKTMFIIFITVLLTVVIMQNTDKVLFKFLFADFMISKLILLLVVGVLSFIIGVLVGRPSKPKYIPGQSEENNKLKKEPDTLSDEDREYIN